MYSRQSFKESSREYSEGLFKNPRDSPTGLPGRLSKRLSSGGWQEGLVQNAKITRIISKTKVFGSKTTKKTRITSKTMVFGPKTTKKTRITNKTYVFVQKQQKRQKLSPA